jgi:AraC-like DNA-binding protein
LNVGAAGLPPGTADSPVEWSRYRRLADLPVEAMRAHFVRHVYDRHSHDAYLFGVTEQGVQAFRCRGSTRASAAGMVMAFNPDDPHDGHAAARDGFTYAMLHLGTDLVADVLADARGRRAGLPLFTEPVVDDGPLAGRLRRLNARLLDGATRLEAQELVMGAVVAMVQRHAGRHVVAPTPRGSGAPSRARDLLHDRFADDLSADDLARAVGLSRFQLYRQFRERYGVPPSAYQRQVRLREARRRLAAGVAIAEVASATGFADQSHLTRWFRRTYGITPRVYQQGGGVLALRPAR